MACNRKFASRFLSIIYPDSLPDNFEELIEGFHIPCLLSPLHDPVSDNGEEKKPHYHLLIDYGSNAKKTCEQVDNVLQDLHGTHCVECLSLKGSVRYFLHLDNPLKQQFPDGVDALKCFSGFDPLPFLGEKFTDERISDIIRDIKLFCIDNGITEYLDLYCYAHSIPQWDFVLNTCNCYSIYRLIDSLRHYHVDDKVKVKDNVKD